MTTEERISYLFTCADVHGGSNQEETRWLIAELRRARAELREIEQITCACRSTTKPDWHSDRCYVPKARRGLGAP